MDIGSDASQAPIPEVNLKYAKIEREHRFLLPSLNEDYVVNRILRIKDRYLTHSNLRLRHIEEDRKPPIFKLGQKIRIPGSLPHAIACTSIYLEREEFENLSSLPGDNLIKVRSIISKNGYFLSYDRFFGELTGLILGEIDLGESGTLPSNIFEGALADVSLDERFTGGILATTNSAELRKVLNEFR